MTPTKPLRDVEVSFYCDANALAFTGLGDTYNTYDAIRKSQLPLIDAVFSAAFSFMEEEDEDEEG